MPGGLARPAEVEPRFGDDIRMSPTIQNDAGDISLCIEPRRERVLLRPTRRIARQRARSPKEVFLSGAYQRLGGPRGGAQCETTHQYHGLALPGLPHEHRGS